ncbi:hypothetical protein U1Q18_015931 [Sarracenia purpurea var. burkii]
MRNPARQRARPEEAAETVICRRRRRQPFATVSARLIGGCRRGDPVKPAMENIAKVIRCHPNNGGLVCDVAGEEEGSACFFFFFWATVEAKFRIKGI